MSSVITYEDIAKANSEIKTVPIKNKQYAEVPQRVQAFRKVCPDGKIVTEMLSNMNGVCIFKATVMTHEGEILGTGTAYEKEGSNFINETSYIENCETSAVGRALGFAGYGSDSSISSAEELLNAKLNQDDSGKKSRAKKQTQPQEQLPPEAQINMDEPIDEDAAKKLQNMLRTINEFDKTFWTGVQMMFEVEKVTDVKKKDYREIVRLCNDKWEQHEKEKTQ